VITALAAERGISDQHTMRDATTAVLEGKMPAGNVPALTRRLPELTRGEGVLVTEFDGYQPYPGRPPVNPPVGANPYDREQYMLHTLGRVPGQ
jgi:ribosomal protection tetracycline resistance protein